MQISIVAISFIVPSFPPNRGVWPERVPKTAPEKVEMGLWLLRRSTGTLTWVSERLQAGHYKRVPQALSRMNWKTGCAAGSQRKKLRALEAKD